MADDLSCDSYDIYDLRERLSRLSEISSKSLKILNQTELADFGHISNQISTLYGTDGYNLLHNEIISHFPLNINVIPGTIGGYFLGCTSSSGFKYGSECSMPCLTGAPSVQESIDYQKCSKTVLLAPFDEGYNFTILSIGESEPDTALIYITPPFHGFNDDEIKDLENKGIKNIIKSYYDDATNEYSISTPSLINDIPRRKKETQLENTYFTNTKPLDTAVTASNSSKVIHIVLLLIFLGLSGYLIYRWKNKNNLKK